MTFEIFLVLTILCVALVLFITERLEMDLVSLLVLGTLAVTGLVSPTDALSGFSNPAVITVWAMFILSDGLTRTGVADVIGNCVLRFAGKSEIQIITLIMLTAGGLSAFMNNIGVAALMLPVVMDLARRTGNAPSRLLMPLAYGSLLGGLTTLIGTPPNLLVAEALEANGLKPFELFDYAPVGLSVMIAGVAFIAVIGRHILPNKDLSLAAPDPAEDNLQEQYSLQERRFEIVLQPDSPLVGKTLAESRIGSATGLSVVALKRGEDTILVPAAKIKLEAGDQLLMQGRLNRFEEIRGWSRLAVQRKGIELDELTSDEVAVAEVEIRAGSSLVGKKLFQTDFVNRFKVNILAIRDDEGIRRSHLPDITLGAGDKLLLQGMTDRLEPLKDSAHFMGYREVAEDELHRVYLLDERIFLVDVASDSVLIGKTLSKTRFGDAFGLRVLGIVRGDKLSLMPSRQDAFEENDRLIIQGRKRDFEVIRGLQELKVLDETSLSLEDMESESVCMVEAALAPRSSIAGKTPRELLFRNKYGVQIIAIWREGRAYRSNLRDMKLEFGDALLVMGPREQMLVFQDDPDFLFLTELSRRTPKRDKAAIAVLVMLCVLVPVFLGWLPIAVSAVIGAALMVLFDCLNMQQAYRAIEWRSVFLIAGMLPLGTAMHQTGAASYIAEGLMSVLGPYGPWPVIVGLYLITAVATTIIPTAALVVLMAPIVMKSCADIGISPHAAMMAVAMAASASFTSPISHPANVLVMGPGGYRFVDYIKLGAPLALVVMLVVMFTLPMFWPITP